MIADVSRPRAYRTHGPRLLGWRRPTTRCAPCPARAAAPAVAGRSRARGRRSTTPSGACRGALMRVNHVGEVCAQALYSAQALATARPRAARPLRAGRARGDRPPRLDAAAARELGARPSLLNPLWYAGAFGIGLVAGRARRRAQPRLRRRDRAPGRAAPRGPSRAPAGGRPRLARHRRADEGRRGAPRAQAPSRPARPSCRAPVRWAMRAAAKVMTTHRALRLMPRVDGRSAPRCTRSWS